MAHAYLTFRFRLAVHALRQLVASLKSSAEILLLVFTHAMIGLLGLSAFPPMYATSLPPLQATSVLLGYSLLMTLPVVLLRKRILPLDVVRWAHRLPIPPRVQLAADARVTALMLAPLAVLYAVSCLVLLKYGGSWLRAVPGLCAVAASFMLTYALSLAVLTLRSRRLATGRWHTGQQLRAYQPRARLAPLPLLWHRLFWLPFWRGDNVTGMRQSFLFVAAIGSALPWMQAPLGTVRALLALATATFMILLTDRGDKAVREQTALLAPIVARWPTQGRRLFFLARAFAAVPALAVLAAVAIGGHHHGLWQHTAGRVYLIGGALAPLLLVATPVSNERFRVGLVLVLVLFLTAVGSELW